METPIPNFVGPTRRPPAVRKQRVAKRPKAGRSRLVTAKYQATRLNRRSGRPKPWRRMRHAFVARLPPNSYEKAGTISCSVPSSIRRSSRSLLCGTLGSPGAIFFLFGCGESFFQPNHIFTGTQRIKGLDFLAQLFFGIIRGFDREADAPLDFVHLNHARFHFLANFKDVLNLGDVILAQL